MIHSPLQSVTGVHGTNDSIMDTTSVDTSQPVAMTSPASIQSGVQVSPSTQAEQPP